MIRSNSPFCFTTNIMYVLFIKNWLDTFSTFSEYTITLITDTKIEYEEAELQV